MQEGYAHTKWGEVSFEDSGGTEPSILFLHGGAANLRAWDNVVSILETSHRCISIDLPGHGKTPIEPLTLPETREALMAVCERIGVKQPLVVGHSFGGLVSAFISNTAGLVSGAMVIDPYLYDEEVRRHFANLEEALDEVRLMEWPWPDTSDLDAEVERVKSRYAPRPDEGNLLAMIRRGYREVEEEQFRRFPRREDEMKGVMANWSVDITATFKGVKCPLSIVLATEIDRPRLDARRRTVLDIREVLSASESTEFECGHDIPGFMPAELGRYIRSWAKRGRLTPG